MLPLAGLYIQSKPYTGLCDQMGTQAILLDQTGTTGSAPELGGPAGWVLQLRRQLAVLHCLTKSLAGLLGQVGLPAISHCWVGLEAMLHGFWAHWLGGASGYAL